MSVSELLADLAQCGIAIGAEGNQLWYSPKSAATPDLVARMKTHKTQLLDRLKPPSNVHFSSKTDKWETPQDFFDELNTEFNFTVDVCALPCNAKCPTFYTPDDDGLAQPWQGTCWMNPPYGREIGKWMAKALKSSQEGALVVCLVPARTDTRWWHDYAVHGEIRLVKGRLKFGDAKNSAPFPSAVVVFRPTSDMDPNASANEMELGEDGWPVDSIDAANLPPCPKCGSLEQWQSLASGLNGHSPGTWRCMHCEPPTKAQELRETAARLRKSKTIAIGKSVKPLDHSPSNE